MKKIPTIFERDWHGDCSRVLDKATPDCGWVFIGEGVATRKYDGMACYYDGERWFKRREIRDDDIARKGLPEGFVEVEKDLTTAKRVGWIPIGDGPEDKYLREAVNALGPEALQGTYEFVGPKSQGNPEGWACNDMLRHANAEAYVDCPRTFDGLRSFLADKDIEGIVFHHPDGRMAKIKKRDFGMKRAAHE